MLHDIIKHINIISSLKYRLQFNFICLERHMYNKKISNFIPLLSLLFLILGLIPISSTFAQTPTEQLIKNTLQPLDSEKSGLFVLQFSTTGMTESAARAYTNIVAQNINNTNRFNVTYLEEAEELIQKSAPELLPCFEIGCGIQIGKILKAKWVITGHISLTEVGSFVLTVKLVNIFDNSLVFEETMRFTDTNMDRRMYLLSTRIARNVPLIGLIIEANNKIAVISLGGVVSWKALKLAGDKLNEAIIQYARDKFNILLGERTAEKIKIQTASVLPLNEPIETIMRGRDLLTGLPKEIKITDSNIREAITKPIKLIVDNIKATIENTPPELVADLYEKGMVLTGGGALLRGLDTLISQETKMPVHITDEPLTAVVRGTGKVLDDLNNLKDIILPSTKDSGLS